MDSRKIKALQKELENLYRWLGQTMTEPECVKINRIVEVELLLEAESNQ